jgi:hypothetical protein
MFQPLSQELEMMACENDGAEDTSGRRKADSSTFDTVSVMLMDSSKSLVLSRFLCVSSCLYEQTLN